MQTSNIMTTITKERAERAAADLADIEQLPALTDDTGLWDLARRVRLCVRYALCVVPAAYTDEHGRDGARAVAEMEALRGAKLTNWLRGLVRDAVAREMRRQVGGAA